MRGVRLQQVANVPLDPCQAQALTSVETQQRRTSWPYYSTVKFFAPADGDPAAVPVNYVLTQGQQMRAFSYAVGDTRTPAGFTAADGIATIADTNLTARNQTTGGQNVLIYGIALQWLPAALHLNEGEVAPHVVRVPDYRFLASLNEAVGVEMSLNGDENLFRMGTIGMIPGAGGLSGAAPDVAGLEQFAGDPKQLGYPTNGWPTRSNFFKVPEGLVWRNQSNSDSMLNVKFTVTRTISIPSGGDPENATADIPADNDVADVATAEGQSFPTELVAELKVFLVGQVLGPRTRSA